MAACGEPAKLDREEARALAAARERLDEALDTEEVIRTSRAEARRLVRQARRSRNNAPRLAEAVPSLVTRGRGHGDVVDRKGLDAFLRYAETDPSRALHRPAAVQVEAMTSTLDDKDEETEIPGRRGLTAERFLSEAERDVKPIWPDLARKLREAGDDL